MSKFSTFLRKYSGEVRLVTDMFGLVFDSLPIDRQDKARAIEAISNLKAAADNVEKAAASVKDFNAPTASQLKAAVEPTVKEIAKGLIAAAVSEALERLIPSEDHLNAAIEGHVKERLDRDLGERVTEAVRQLPQFAATPAEDGADTQGG